MSWLKAVKSLWQAKKPKKSQDILSIARKCGPAMDQMVLRIFELQGSQIMQADNNYLVHAIWGVRQGAPLDHTQEYINREFKNTFQVLIRALDLGDLSDAQEYALGYLIRDLAITKLVYMAEKAKSSPGGRSPSAEPDVDLASMDVIGSA